MPTCLCCRLVQISCACRRWKFHLSRRRRHSSQGAVGTRASHASPGFPKGNPSNVSVLGSTGELQLSHAGSRTQSSCRMLNCLVPMQVSPAHDPPDGPCALLCWLGDRKENSALISGLGNLLSDFSPSKRKNTRTRGFTVV